MEQVSLLDQTAWQFKKGPGVAWGRFPLLNLVDEEEFIGCALSVDLEDVCCQKMITLDMS